MTDERELTPITRAGNLLIKREDEYAPFGKGGVNGGKCRQCYLLVDSVKDEYDGVVTYCSINSPQAPITAAVAQHFGLPCIVAYGGTSKEVLMKSDMAKLVMHYGAKIVIAARTGRHNVLHAAADKIAKEKNYFLVQYGINLTEHEDVLLQAVARQVENIPDVKNLVMVCGSGITATGVMIGLHQYGKNVEKVHLVATAPDRREFIHGMLKKHGADRDFEYCDVNNNGLMYDKPCHAVYRGIELHPNYEAKAMRWLMKSGLDEKETLFWITGRYPAICKQIRLG